MIKWNVSGIRQGLCRLQLLTRSAGHCRCWPIAPSVLQRVLHLWLSDIRSDRMRRTTEYRDFRGCDPRLGS
jgi:hypothetical protein